MKYGYTFLLSVSLNICFREQRQQKRRVKENVKFTYQIQSQCWKITINVSF